MDKINETEESIKKFSEGYKYYGMIFNDDNSVTCREWAPGAVQLYLTGEFSELLLLVFFLFFLIFNGFVQYPNLVCSVTSVQYCLFLNFAGFTMVNIKAFEK